MIASSRSLKTVALAAAIGLHAALAVALIRDEPVMVEGSGSQEAQLGTSFADMAQGTLMAEETTEVLEPEAQPEEVTQAQPEEPVQDSPTPDAPQPVTPPTPLDTAQVPQDTMALSVPETLDGALAIRPEVTEPTQVTPDTLAALPEALQPEAPVTPQDTMEALNPDSDVPLLSKRPMRRDPAIETPEPVRKAQPKPTPKPATTKPKATQPKPKPQQANRGNSTQNAKTGTTRGTAEKANTRQGSGSAKSKQAGNAAVSNYPGLVNRHLARVRKPSLNRRGTVRVSFAIASSGGLAGVSVSRSSGSSQLDQAAMTMIRRAAPFPRPPAGAQRNFSISIQFR